MKRNMVELVRLNEILEMDRAQQLNVHLDEIQEIVDALDPEDFAVFGQRLCHLLIDIANGKRVVFRCESENSLFEENTRKGSPPASPPKTKSKAKHKKEKDTGPVYGEYPQWIPNRPRS